MPLAFTQDQLALINLLLRLAVMAGITSLILGFRFTDDILVKVSVPAREKVKLTILLAVIFSVGVLIRKMSAQAAMDLSLEGAILAGLLGGTWVGAGTGFAIGLTCFLIGETVSLPLYTAAGFTSGFLYSRLGRGGEVWSYSLNPFLAIYNFLERLFHGSLDRNFMPVVLCIGFALLRYALLEKYMTSGLIYGYPTRDWLFITIDLAVLVYTVGMALKLAANARDGLIHREEEKQLVHARLTTLRSQINPHFLFNTLNSITSLIRTDAERAREMTRQLSSIFRKSLDDTGDTHTLASEIDFLDDYLSIERVRFGDERFKVVKELDETTLGIQVPSLLLQPLVENAVKHGIACRTEGGRVCIRSAHVKGGTEITIENDGPETGPLDKDSLLGKGVGLRNVAERLEIYSCGEGRMKIDARPGGGAIVQLFIPESAGRGKEIAGTCTDRR
jgi:two-component system LytT family sensor kinase